MTKLFLRNVKKGFATNSSSYHSTILRYIDVPERIWLEFINSEDSNFVDTPNGGYMSGIALKDDEGDTWHSYKSMTYEASNDIKIEDLGMKDGENWVQIVFETVEEYN